MEQKKANNYNTQQIVLNNGFDDVLFKAIQENSKNASILTDEQAKVIIDRNDRLQAKLDKYKRINDKDEVYYYFFPRELKDIVWILLENIANKN